MLNTIVGGSNSTPHNDFNAYDLSIKQDSLSQFNLGAPTAPSREADAIEIPADIVTKLQITAKRVGGAFGVEVRLGQPGGGSYYNPASCSIVLDPLHVKGEPDKAIFIAGHEGAHRAITVGPSELGIPEKQIDKLYSQLGFGFIHNVPEDGAVNSWMRRQDNFPGMNEYVKKFYDDELKAENAQLGTPEIAALAQRLGYWPRFAQYGSEVLRDWHQGRYSNKLDRAVEKALKRTIKHARRVIETLPEEGSQSRDNIIKAAQERFTIVTDRIWPEVQKLVELDLNTEAKRQAMNTMLGNDSNNSGGNQSGATQPSLPEKAKQELKDAIKNAQHEQATSLSNEIQAKQKEAKQAHEKQQQLSKDLQELGQKDQSADDKQKSQIKKDIEAKQQQQFEEQLKEALAQKEIDKKIETALQDNEEASRIKEAAKQGAGDLSKALEEALQRSHDKNQSRPLPIDKLSQETKDALDELLKQLDSRSLREIENKAKAELEKLEDALNQKFSAKLSTDQAPSHEDLQKKRELLAELHAQNQQDIALQEQAEDALRKYTETHLSDYEKTRRLVSDRVDEIYARLKSWFLAQNDPDWEAGYDSGGRPNLEIAMQAEADPELLPTIWERRDLPTTRDEAFEFWIDTSGSMAGEKALETFKGSVFVAELMERLGPRYEIHEFSIRTNHLKCWEDSIKNEEVRGRLGRLKNANGPDTYDALALREGYERLCKQPSKFKFMVIITDALSNYPDQTRLIVKQIVAEKKVVLVHFGIGPGTADSMKLYPHSFGNLNVAVNKAEHAAGKKDFAEVFAEVVEGMVRTPEKYFSESERRKAA